MEHQARRIGAFAPDDTETSIAIANALMDSRPFTEDLIIEHLAENYLETIKHKGYARNGYGSLKWFFDGKMSMDELRDFQKNRLNPGNGAVVRCLPIALKERSEINYLATVNANATHPNSKAVQACKMVTHGVHYLWQKNGLRSGLIPYVKAKAWLDLDFRHYLNKIDLLPDFHKLEERDFIILCGPQPIQKPYFLDDIYGLPSDAKFTAGCFLYILKWAKTSFEALQYAVKMGGDVDSLAALTVGAFAGLDNLKDIPKFMLEKAEKPYLIHQNDSLC